MGTIIVAPVGNNTNALYVGLKELNVEKVILISSKKLDNKASKIKEDLNKFKIPSEIVKVGKFSWEQIFMVISKIKNKEEKEILINVATGDTTSRCATTCAAFVNGIKAFDVEKDKVMMLPILKFSYYRLIPDRKMDILNYLFKDQECCASLEELSKKLKMSLPLISYHVNGTLKSEGLETMGLVETAESKRKVKLKLTSLGRMLVNGYIEQSPDIIKNKKR